MKTDFEKKAVSKCKLHFETAPFVCQELPLTGKRPGALCAAASFIKTEQRISLAESCWLEGFSYFQ